MRMKQIAVAIALAYARRSGLSLGAIALEVDDVAALPEFQRPWYEQDAATKKFKLNPAKVEVEDVAGLKTALGRERDNVKAAKALAQQQLEEALKPYAGIDPEEMKGIMSKFASEEERRLIKEGKIEDVIEKRMAKHTEAQEKLIREAKEREEGALEVASTFMERVLDNEVREAAVKMGLHPSAIDDALLHARSIFTINDDGKAVQLDPDTEEPVLGKDGKTPFSPLEWLEGMKEKKPHWWPAGASGGGAGGGKHLGGKQDLSGLSPTARLTAARAAQSK